ncbi:MAG: hypothetical protein IPH57_17995 [Saprospiraceae bacterium]|nr:hypothetical protein [Saprospiraceae bacterium]
MRLALVDPMLKKSQVIYKIQREEHHEKTWDDEYNEFITKYGFPDYEG